MMKLLIFSRFFFQKKWDFWTRKLNYQNFGLTHDDDEGNDDDDDDDDDVVIFSENDSSSAVVFSILFTWRSEVVLCDSFGVPKWLLDVSTTLLRR